MADGLTLTRYDITDLNNGAIPEFPVDDPPGWDAISLYYAKALQKMGWNQTGIGQALDAPPYPPGPIDRRRFPVPGTPNPANTWSFHETPDSYFFWGAMHWWPGENWELWNTVAPAPQNEYWSHCTHGPANVEKYFLPWHRAYVYFFEVVVRAKVAELGGPDSWALPYWNYSYYEPANGSSPWPRSRLPWVFCQAELPDGSGNPLFLDDTRRGLQPEWPDGQPMFLTVDTPYYAAAYGQPDFEPPSQSSAGFNQTLDGRPHGAVHVDTGTGDGLISATGWMQKTQLAGFDPIFWLHHTEIDRFWVGWNDAGGEDPGQQTDPDWLTAGDDDIAGRWNFWSSANIQDVVVVHPGDMLDPANLTGPEFPYSYRYQDLPTVPAPKQGGRAIVAEAMPRLTLAGSPAEVGAARRTAPAAARREIASSDEAVEVVHEPVTMTVSLGAEAPTLLRSLDGGAEGEGPHRTLLLLDGIVTEGSPGNYEVYLNNSDVDRDTAGEVPHFVGLFSAFGSDHSHGDEGGDHDHHGLSASYDITDLVAYLRANGEWDDSSVQVTFVPAIPRVEGLTPVISPVTIGSVRIVTE